MRTWYVDQITPLLKRNASQSADVRQVVSQVMDIVLSWPEYSIAILGNEKEYKVVDDVFNITYDAFMKNLKQDDDVDPEISKFQFIYMFYGYWNVIRSWCQSGMKEDKETVLRALESII